VDLGGAAGLYFLEEHDGVQAHFTLSEGPAGASWTVLRIPALLSGGYEGQILASTVEHRTCGIEGGRVRCATRQERTVMSALPRVPFWQQRARLYRRMLELEPDLRRHGILFTPSLRRQLERHSARN
jgi:hypothetical protein